MFSPFAPKKIDTQLATLTVIFFLSRVGGRDAKSTWVVLFYFLVVHGPTLW